MTLLAPLFLLGLASIALPIWLHRMSTQSPKRERFSSAMLLEESTQQTYISKQLQYILLSGAKNFIFDNYGNCFCQTTNNQTPSYSRW